MNLFEQVYRPSLELARQFLPSDIPAEAFLGGLLLGAVACGAYVLAWLRHHGQRFSLLDFAMVVALMAASTAIAISIIAPASSYAKYAALEHNWYLLQQQIERYKLDHNGQAPLVYKGTLPQLTRATNRNGTPGPPGPEFPYGPYLPGGIPVNPITGSNYVVPVKKFPPEKATTIGGWLYDQSSGKIVPDLPEYVDTAKRATLFPNLSSTDHWRLRISCHGLLARTTDPTRNNHRSGRKHQAKDRAH